MKTSDPRKQQLQCGSKTLYGTHAYNLETANFDKIASKAQIKPGEIFPETTVFMIAFHEQVLSNNNHNKRTLKDPNTTNDIGRKNADRNQT